MPIKWGCCKNVFSLVTFANFWVDSQAKDFFKQHRMFTIGVHFPTLFGYNSSFSTIYRPVHRLNRLLSKSWLWFFLFLFLPKSQKRVYIKNAFVSQKWLFFPHKWFYNNSWHFSNKAEIIQLKNNMVSRQISNKQESMERMKLLQTLNNKNNCFFFFCVNTRPSSFRTYWVAFHFLTIACVPLCLQKLLWVNTFPQRASLFSFPRK